MTKKRGLFSPEIARLGVEAFDWSIASQRDKAPSGTRRDWRPGFTRGVSGNAAGSSRSKHAFDGDACVFGAPNRVARAHTPRRDSMSSAGTHARVHACSTSRARRSLGGVGALRATRVSAPRQRRGLGAAASSDDASSAGASASASDATKFDALLAELGACPDADFAEFVASTREQFTVAFYEHAASRVEALAMGGEKEKNEAKELDRLCGSTMAAAETAFGADLTSAGDVSGGFCKEVQHTNGGLTVSNEAELAARRDAVSARLAAEGEKNALAQLERNAVSRKDSATALLGRVPVGERELRTLNMVTSERRIIDVLLTVPDGPEREETLTDALTPPETTGGGDDDGASEKQMRLDDDSGVLTGDEEEVFTTPARLLAAVELAVKESLEAGDDADVVADLRALRRSVAARCDFL